MQARVGPHLNLQSVVLSAFGRDEHGALCGLAAIEYNGLCTFQEGDLVDFARHDIGCITRHTIYHDQITGIVAVHSPKRITVKATDIPLHIVKAVGIIVLFHQVGHVDNGYTAEDILLGHLAIGHLHHFLLRTSSVGRLLNSCLCIDTDRSQHDKACQKKF